MPLYSIEPHVVSEKMRIFVENEMMLSGNDQPGSGKKNGFKIHGIGFHQFNQADLVLIRNSNKGFPLSHNVNIFIATGGTG